ncbi:pre-mRNA-splicing factor CWC25 homolog isoform X1 [Folsomia candida]|uniref:pre-mRNA-splicing factor CWC25 homolog isoform X1 n=1 Tax=Folsomia candida TaxID=158441 RepID=UPI000B8F3E1E|nr:pre-mRNA-splicing factor CWC25 homolog isoform X1 [Folsomia candida]
MERLEPEQGKTLDWMYDGPSALVNREDYLLGRKVDKSFQMLEAAEKGNSAWLSEAEKDLTPQSILKPSGTGGAVDVVRKIKDDPLYQIQKKEQEYRKQILQNPVLLKKIQQQHGIVSEESSTSKKSKKVKKSKTKKHKTKDKNSSDNDTSSSSDEEINQLLKSLTNSKDITKLLGSQSSTATKGHHKDKPTNEKGQRQRRHDSDSDDEDDRRRQTRTRSTDTSYRRRRRSRSHSRSPQHHCDHRLDKRDCDRSQRDYRREVVDERYPRTSTSRDNRYGSIRREVNLTSNRPHSSTKKKMDEDEMERRRQEMMGNAKERDEERQRIVEKHREEILKEQELLEKNRKTNKHATFIRFYNCFLYSKQLADAASTGSVEQRVRSNAYNIQRSKFSMDTNFARR